MCSAMRFLIVFLMFDAALGGDPYAYIDWDVSFISAAPLGVKQQVCEL